MKLSVKKMASALLNRALITNNPYYFFGIPNADYSTQGRSINLKKLGIIVDKVEGETILRGYPFAIKIKEALSCQFYVDKGSVYFEFDSLKFRINSPEELFIIYEVFVSNEYKYCSSRDTLFVDIGMNSGITTLYYASNPAVKRIYSFELFQPTFLLGEQNLQLNPKYASKVQAFNYGLSDKNFETVLDYSLSNKGRMGLNGLPTSEIFADARKEKVSVKDINVVFEDILVNSGGLDVVVKMDCEGEECRLVNRLSKGGTLGRINALIIEWHNNTSLDIEEILSGADFHVFSQRYPNLDTGMIYAVRR